MENFQFSMPTQVYFGKDEIKQLPAVISQFGKRVLLAYGGGSIKRMGIYDKVKELLADCEIFEVGGIMPNPRVESVMKTIIRYAPIALQEPDNYEARALLLWGSNIADNATLACGNKLAVFGVHGMEHELSAFYDITHGVGLAILEPRWMRYVLNEQTEARFAHYGKAVWGIDEPLSDREIAEKAIQMTEDWFRSLDIPMTLTEIGIGEEHFEEMAQHCVEHEGVAYAWIPLSKEDIMAIFKACL